MLLVIAATLAIGFFLYRSLVPLGEKPGVGQTSGYDWKVVNLDGEPVDLSDYKGRPVFLNVWATWCGPCRVEMPSILQLAQQPELKDADVAVLLVSVDQGLEPVLDYVEQNPPDPARVLVAAEAPPEEFSTAGIPATFLIAPDGTIVDSHVGSRDWNTPEVVDRLVSMAK